MYPWLNCDDRQVAMDVIDDMTSPDQSSAATSFVKGDFMSMSPNDPFEDQQNDPAFGQVPPPKKGGKGCLIGCVVAFVLGLMVCCGGGGVMIYVGLSILSDEYSRQLAGNPVIVEHIGEIESIEASWSATIEEAQKAGDQGTGAPVAFEVEGSKGSGTLLVEQDQSGGGSMIKSATLILPDGTRIPIDVSVTPSALEELEDLGELVDPGEIETPESTETLESTETPESQPN
jgi:hypothetical protein